MGKYTVEEFNKLDDATKKLFGGTYEGYESAYNIINPTEKTETTPQTNPYDAYMQTATDVYNKSVEQNNNASANQAAAAGAEYRELNRNVNEINKANGRANTGYAGDTSIDGYNAYRNSLNEIYSQRDKANNDLYSYYMNSMMQIQQAKDAKEASDREFELSKKAYQSEQDNIVLGKVSEFFNNENAYDSVGNIKSEYADKAYNLLINHYGGEENIPESVKFELSSYPGIDDYLNAYNSNGKINYTNVNVEKNKLLWISNNGQVQSENNGNSKQFAVIDGAKSNKSTDINDGASWNNFTATINGKPYKLETGDRSEMLEGDIADYLKEQIKHAKGREAIEGDFVIYDEKVYVVGNNGKLCVVDAREGSLDQYDDFLKEVLNNMGMDGNSVIDSYINKKWYGDDMGTTN